jgi:hypothetical protein
VQHRRRVGVIADHDQVRVRRDQAGVPAGSRAPPAGSPRCTRWPALRSAASGPVNCGVDQAFADLGVAVVRQVLVDRHPPGLPDRFARITSAVPSGHERFCHTFEG